MPIWGYIARPNHTGGVIGEHFGHGYHDGGGLICGDFLRPRLRLIPPITQGLMHESHSNPDHKSVSWRLATMSSMQSNELYPIIAWNPTAELLGSLLL